MLLGKYVRSYLLNWHRGNTRAPDKETEQASIFLTLKKGLACALPIEKPRQAAGFFAGVCCLSVIVHGSRTPAAAPPQYLLIRYESIVIIQ